LKQHQEFVIVDDLIMQLFQFRKTRSELYLNMSSVYISATLCMALEMQRAFHKHQAVTDRNSWFFVEAT
jgi:hypothetical protein